MNAQQRMEHLFSIEFPTPLEVAELDTLIDELSAQSRADEDYRISRQELWAECGGYAAGLARPV